ncbi:MAG: ABC transporter ATP-binding protein [Oscillospiraceae bacterium]|nr:ABC transporter ATP-binding protein [Oscillospiraceae bacterium]
MAEKKYASGPKGGGPGGGHGPGARGGYQKPKNAGKTLRRLMGYITRRKLPLLLAALCVILSAVTGVANTYLLRPLLNDLVSSMTAAEKVAMLGRTLLKMLGLFLVGASCTYGQSAIMAQLAHRGVARLRSELFDKLQELPLQFFDAHTHGELMSRFSNDADYVQQCLEQSIVSLISSVITFAGIVAMMLYTSWPLFLVTLLMLGATMGVFVLRGKKSRELYRSQQQALGQLNGNIQEMIEGLKVVKAFTHEEAAEAEFGELNEKFYSVARDANFYATSIMPLAGNISNVGYAATAIVGGVLTFVMGFDIGGLATFLQYCRQVTQPINQVSQQINAILSALAGAERIFEIMDMPPEVDEGNVHLVRVRENEDGTLSETTERTEKWAWKLVQEDGSTILQQVEGDVRLHNVDFSYVPEKKVLKNITFYAKPGQKIAFVGSTGAGKTTITNLFNRFYEIQEGSITYDGIDIRLIAKDDLRRATAMVLQETNLFTGTVMDNIRYGRLDATDEECVAAAKLASAHSFIRRLPDGYNTMVTANGANLSQGQRQLLAIARAAVADPPVLILDEATSSIDTRTERLIEKGLDRLMEGRTVFVIAHRLSTVRNANCIVVIEHGEIMEKGDHAQLLALKGRYYDLYTGQSVLD